MSHAAVLVNVGRMADLVEDGYAEEGELPSDALLEGRTVAVESGPLMDLMEPYNENTEVPRYRDYLSQRAKASEIQTVTKPLEKHEATLDKRYEDPPTPRERTGGDTGTVDQATWERYVNEYEMAWENIAALYTDEEVAAAYNTYWTKEDSGGERLYVDTEVGARGHEHIRPAGQTSIYRWSTYNPQSKWDWWTIGGRWAGTLRLKSGGWRIVNTKGWDATWWSENGWASSDSAEIFTEDEKAKTTLPTDGEWVPAGLDVAFARDIDWDHMFEDGPPGHAYLDAAEGWMENSKLIWFGMSTDGQHQEDEWGRRFHAWVDALPEDAVIVAVDYHI